MFENQSVEMNMPNEIAPADAAQAQGESLESIAAEVPAAEAAPAAEEQAPAKEPGWVKGRIDKAVAKAEARIRAEYEAKLAPIYESIYDRQAEELVSAGEFKSLDRAKEYVRMKAGLPVETPAEKPAEASSPARDAQGRFAAQKPAQEAVDPVIQAQADLLTKQADKIKRSQGLDVMGYFNNDPGVKEKVLSGEWDFYDVADAMRNRNSHPTPIRSANGGAPGSFDIARMTPEQFKRLNENLATGHRYDLNK